MESQWADQPGMEPDVRSSTPPTALPVYPVFVLPAPADAPALLPWRLRVLIWFAACAAAVTLVSVPFALVLLARAGSIDRLSSPAVRASDWAYSMGLDAALFVVLFAAAVLMAKYLDHRPAGSLGLAFHSRWLKEFTAGCLAGTLLLSLVMALLIAVGAYRFEGRQSYSLTVSLGWAVVLGLGFLSVALTEEFSCRGYLLQVLVSALRLRWVILITAIVFTLPHLPNPGELKYPIGILDVFVSGVLLAVLVIRTRSLWMAVGLHAAWDWSQNFLFGVADSGVVTPGGLFHCVVGRGPVWLTGAAVGPEGSVVALVVDAAAIVVFWRARWLRPAPEAAALWDRYVRPAPTTRPSVSAPDPRTLEFDLST